MKILKSGAVLASSKTSLQASSSWEFGENVSSPTLIKVIISLSPRLISSTTIPACFNSISFGISVSNLFFQTSKSYIIRLLGILTNVTLFIYLPLNLQCFL